MKLLVTYRFRLYPNRRQERQMEDTLETCRRLYNSLLADRKEKRTSFYEQERSLVTLKSEEKFLRAVNAQVLQDVVLRLDKAFQAFFTGLSRHPRFKREGRYSSFTYPQLGGFKITGSRLKLSKVGLVKVKLHRALRAIQRGAQLSGMWTSGLLASWSSGRRSRWMQHSSTQSRLSALTSGRQTSLS